MRRLSLVATFLLVLALPLWAQHGGGHGGGHAGGFGGGHAGGFGRGFGGHAGFGGGHIGGGHFGGGMHRSPGFSRGFTRAPHSEFSSRGSFHGRRGPFISNGFHHRRCWNCGRRRWGGYPWSYGWGWNYPWWYSGYYDPYWWWDHGSSYDEDYERDRQIAAEMNQQNLEEMQMLRQEDADGDQDAYARSSAPQRPADPPQAQAVPITPATVLVYRDQHKQEVENYAIVGQTLWNFSPQRTQKIPLADLDLQATLKANDDRGVTFKVPTIEEAQ